MTLGPAMLLALAAAGAVAGCLGAMIGIGGGVLLVPALVIGFHVPPHEAVAASLVAVVATSTAAGSVYVGEGLANMRLGMSLEVATTVGGITGGLVAARVSPEVLSGAFSALLGVTAVLLARGDDPHERTARKEAAVPRPEVGEHGLGGTYYDAREDRVVRYEAVRWPVGAAVSLFAGVVSGLLGVGGGFLKVPAMSLGMRVPIRVAAATSNFMIGVTAISSLFVYFARGDLAPFLAAPVALGVVLGSIVGTHLGGRVPTRALRLVTSAALVGVAVEMLVRALRGGDHGA